MPDTTDKPGDLRLDHDPAALPGDARLIFIGRVHSAWKRGERPPRNPTAARATQEAASVEIDPPFRPGLAGLEAATHVWVLAWLHEARRDLIAIEPPNAKAPAGTSPPRGVFAVRSPVRPNPIGLSACRILGVDVARGIVRLDAIDFLDATPVIDLKPYRPGIDAIAGARAG